MRVYTVLFFNVASNRALVQQWFGFNSQHPIIKCGRLARCLSVVWRFQMPYNTIVLRLYIQSSRLRIPNFMSVAVEYESKICLCPKRCLHDTDD